MLGIYLALELLMEWMIGNFISRMARFVYWRVEITWVRNDAMPWRNREAHRAQWRQQAEQRLAKARRMDEKSIFSYLKGPIKLVWKLSCGLARVQFTQFVKQLDLDVLGSVLITPFVKLVVKTCYHWVPWKKKLGRGRTTWRCWEGCGRIRSHEDTEIHLEQGWRQVLWMEEDLPPLWLDKWEPGEGGLLAEALITPTSMRTGLRLVIPNGFWLFFCLAGFWVDLAAFWVLWILAWTWIFFVTFESLKRLVAGSARRDVTRTIVSWVKLSYQVCPTYLWWLPPHPWASQVLVVAWGDWHISVKEVLFERPYIVHSGADLIAAIANGVDPSTIQAMAGGLPLPMTPVGVPTTYCRSTTVTKERGIIKSTMDHGPSDAVWQYDFKRN